MALFNDEEIEEKRNDFLKNMEKEIEKIEKEIEDIKKNNKKRKIVKNLNIRKIYLYISIPFILLPGYLLMGFNAAKVTPFYVDKDKYYKTWKTDIDCYGNKYETAKYDKEQNETDKLYYLSDWYQREDGRFEREEKIYDVENLAKDEVFELVKSNEVLKLEPLQDNLISSTKRISKTKPEEQEPNIKAEIYDEDKSDTKEVEETEKTNKISTITYLGLVCAGEYALKKKYPKSSSYKYLKQEIDDLEEKYKPLTDEKLKKRLAIIKENYNVLTRR